MTKTDETAGNGPALSRREMLLAGAATALVPALGAAESAMAPPRTIKVAAYGRYEAHHMHFPERGPME